MRTVLLCLLATITLWAGSLYAQDSSFQAGKIVTVEKLASGGSVGGTDAPTAQNQQRYNVSIQLSDTVYVCRVSTTQDKDLDWAQGKEVPVKVKGKTLYLKRANGSIVKLSILSTKKAG